MLVASLVCSELSEVLFAILARRQALLFVLAYNMPPQHQNVHVGHGKTAERVVGGTHDGFATDVKAGIDQHRAIGLLVKRCQQLMQK